MKHLKSYETYDHTNEGIISAVKKGASALKKGASKIKSMVITKKNAKKIISIAQKYYKAKSNAIAILGKSGVEYRKLKNSDNVTKDDRADFQKIKDANKTRADIQNKRASMYQNQMTELAETSALKKIKSKVLNRIEMDLVKDEMKWADVDKKGKLTDKMAELKSRASKIKADADKDN